MAGYVGWAAILKCNHALSTDNLRRALKNSTDSQDISELQQILDTRTAYHKATNTTPPAAWCLLPKIRPSSTEKKEVNTVSVWCLSLVDLPTAV